MATKFQTETAIKVQYMVCKVKKEFLLPQFGANECNHFSPAVVPWEICVAEMFSLFNFFQKGKTCAFLTDTGIPFFISGYLFGFKKYS